MPVTNDILQSWWQPRAVMRQHLRREASEPFALTLLLAFLLLAFVAQWPGIARISALNPAQPMAPHLLGRAMALLATLPLWYGLAWVLHRGLRSAGGRGTPYQTRLALFWALLAAAPAMLVQGLVAGLIATGAAQLVAGVSVFALFLWLAIQMQREAHFG